MKSAFRSSFLRDLRKLAEDDVQEKVREAILAVEAAPNLRDTPGVKKLSGSGPYFRIRVGDYRIGMRVDDDLVTFVRVLHRRDIYRYFP